ncbi:MAG: GNAT family N-acetyltransferase, partial [Gemmatimonadales bacterium]
LDGAVVAFALVFELRRGLQYYWPTYREDTSGSGLYLLADIVRSCCDRRLPEFDFLQGDESYKLDWMTHEHRSDEIVIPGRSVRGGSVARLIRFRWWLAGSDRLKEWRRRALVAWRRVRY